MPGFPLVYCAHVSQNELNYCGSYTESAPLSRERHFVTAAKIKKMGTVLIAAAVSITFYICLYFALRPHGPQIPTLPPDFDLDAGN